MAVEKYKGVPIFMNGKTYLIPALSVKQFNQFSSLLVEPASVDTQESLNDLIQKNLPMILAAVQRNYPDVNTENLTDWIDLGNWRDVMLAVQAVSPIPVQEPA